MNHPIFLLSPPILSAKIFVLVLVFLRPITSGIVGSGVIPGMYTQRFWPYSENLIRSSTIYMGVRCQTNHSLQA